MTGRPTLVFVHGAGGGGWEWIFWQSEAARAGWPAQAPDLIPAADGLISTTVDDYATQVRSWVDLAPKPVVLVGASLGGLLALMVAADCSPTALILVNPVPPAGIGEGWHRPDRTVPEIEPWGAEASYESTREAIPDAAEETWRWSWRRWRDESGAVLRQIRAGVPVRVTAVPTLIVASEYDDDIPADVSRSLAAVLGADVVDVPGASHVGPLLGRSATDTARASLAWLAEVVTGR